MSCCWRASQCKLHTSRIAVTLTVVLLPLSASLDYVRVWAAGLPVALHGLLLARISVRAAHRSRVAVTLAVVVLPLEIHNEGILQVHGRLP